MTIWFSFTIIIQRRLKISTVSKISKLLLIAGHFDEHINK